MRYRYYFARYCDVSGKLLDIHLIPCCCRSWVVMLAELVSLRVDSITVVMVLRVYAMWDRSRTVLGILLFIYMAQIIISCVWAGIDVNPNETLFGMFRENEKLMQLWLIGPSFRSYLQWWWSTPLIRRFAATMSLRGPSYPQYTNRFPDLFSVG